MTAPLDVGVDKLEAFCALLRSTNPLLEAGAGDLGHAAHDFEGSGSHLAQEIQHLSADVDGLEKEAEAGETAVTSACADLYRVAGQSKTEVLAKVEGEAAAAGTRTVQALDSAGEHVASAFEVLDEAGWEPLVTILKAASEQMEHWTTRGDGAIEAITKLFTEAAAEIQQGIDHAEQVERALGQSPPFSGAFWSAAQQGGEHVTEETIPSFRQEAHDATQKMHTTQEQLVLVTAQAGSEVRTALADHGTKAAEALDGQAAQVTQAVGETADALDLTEVELERAQVQMEHVKAEAEGFGGLAEQISHAQQQLQQIQAAMEALGQ